MLEEALKFARGPKEESTKEIDQQHRREATDKDRLDVLTHIWQDRIRYIGCLEAGMVALSLNDAFRMTILMMIMGRVGYSVMAIEELFFFFLILLENWI